MTSQKPFEETCTFQTERLLIEGLAHSVSPSEIQTDLAERVISILTPAVTKALPPGWQQIDTRKKAIDWITARNEESEVCTIRQLPTRVVVGFLFLNAENSSNTDLFDIRLGYLLAEEVWGRGLGSELIRGLVAWCEQMENISSISGGVETNNKASIRVLEKNGFSILPVEGNSTEMIFLERKFK